MSLDRTSEFLSIAEALPVTRAPQPPPPPPTASLQSFHATAASISKDIAGTSQLLQELTHLVRHQSLWDQSQSSNVNQLVVRIKSSMENLNARLDDAHRTLQRHKQLNKQASQEAANVVGGLQLELAEAATGFKQVLQQRTDRLKENQTFEKHVYGNAEDEEDDNPMPNMSALMSPPPVFGSESGGGFPQMDLTSSLMASGEPTGQTLPRPRGVSAPLSSSNTMRQRHTAYAQQSSMYSSAAMDEVQPMTPLDWQRYDEESGQEQQMQLLPTDHDYLQQRANAMTTVESQLTELGSIFNKLAVMVSEHKELVQRVEDNVEDANANLTLSLGVLTDTFENLRSNRSLMMRLFAVLVTFIIIFIVGFA